MPIADPRYFTREHIEAQRFGASPQLAEQAIHCLELVAELAATGLTYQFKGGNSLLLVLDNPRRFSIDVDIATNERREQIQSSIERLVRTHGVFTRWEPRPHKTKPWLPIASYHLFYRSVVDPGHEGCLMLDIQLRRSPYRTRRAPVKCGALYVCEQTVELPLAASIAGDKLLTLGPSTLGIPLGKGKQAQRLKHVYDISCLMTTEPDVADIRASFNACLEHENEIQGKSVTAREVMLDTVKLCASVTGLSEPPADPARICDNMLRENVEGLPDFGAHLFERGYDWRQLQLDMARTAWCVTAVCTEAVTQARFAEVTRGTAPLEPLRTGDQPMPGLTEEARYYWAHTLGVSRSFRDVQTHEKPPQ